MRRESQQPLAFVQRFLDQREVAVLQIAQATVHQPATARTRAGRDITCFEQQRRHTAHGGLASQSSPLDPGADHDNVKGLAIKLSGISAHLGMDCCVQTDTVKG